MRHLKLALLLLLMPSLSTATVFNVIGDSQLISGFSTASGSNFTMFDGVGNVVQPGSPEIWPSTNDILGTFDDSLICTPSDGSACTKFAMTLSSATPTKFAGGLWSAHDIRVFAPGTYTIETCPPPIDGSNVASDGSTACGAQASGNTQITFTVGAGQLGIHMLFDYPTDQPVNLQSLNIDVIEVVNINSTFTVPGQNLGTPFPIPADTRAYTLASTDVGSWLTGSTTILSEGVPGVRMSDGPFFGFRANFNLFLDGSLSPPPVNITVTAGTVTGNIVTPGGGAVTLDAGSSFAPGTTFEWSASDAALVSALTGPDTTSETFVFDPSGFTAFQNLTARVVAVDGSLTASTSFMMRMGCIASTQGALDSDGDGVDDATEACSDSDGDGVLDYLDASNSDASTISTILNGPQAATSAGAFTLGSTALITSDANANLGSGIALTSDDLGVKDSDVIASCVGGCFDFVVTGLAGAGSVQVVLPLSATIPASSEYKKLLDGSWKLFVEDDKNKVDSAAKVSGSCPAPGSADYTDKGLVAGNECIQLTIEDNGPNDADSTVDTIADPSGVSESEVVVVPPLETKIDGGSLGLYSLLMMFVAFSFRRKMR